MADINPLAAEIKKKLQEYELEMNKMKMERESKRNKLRIAEENINKLRREGISKEAEVEREHKIKLDKTRSDSKRNIDTAEQEARAAKEAFGQIEKTIQEIQIEMSRLSNAK